MDSSCLHEQFERQVALAPEAAALTFEGAHLTYAELNGRANQLASYLRECGVDVETRVGLCLDRGFDTVVAILAVLKAGGAYVPMDPIYPAERVRMISEDAACPIILVHQEYKERFVATDDVRVVVMDGGECPWEHQPTENLPPVAEPSNLAYVIFTSGSTGRPKGVLITHHNVWRLIVQMDPWFDFGLDDVWTLFHSYAFDFSVWEMWGAFYYGGRLVVVPHCVSQSPEMFYQLLVDERVTVVNQTPSAFRQLQHYEESLSVEVSKDLALEYVIFGGEVLEMSGLKSWFARHGDSKPALVNMYGITETTVFVTYRPVSMEDTEPGSPNFIGIPIPDLTVYVLNEDLTPVDTGIEGELYVGGAGVGRGYLNRPELTDERFVASPFAGDDGMILYRSGDLVRELDGDIIYIGRKDGQVQIRGFRVELGEIENCLTGMEALQSAAVTYHHKGEGDGRLVAYYVASSTVSVKQFREYLSQILPDYMIPARFMRVDSMPLTANGKLDYRALPDPVICARNDVEYMPPRDDVEAKLVEIWEEVLGIEKPGIDDDFYELGGHSLSAIRIGIYIREKLGIQVPLQARMVTRSIRKLAFSLSNVTSLNEGLSVIPGILEIERPDSIPLSFSESQLWILEQKSPGMTAYNCAFMISLRGNVVPDLVFQSINSIVRRHEILRTTFSDDSGVPARYAQLYSPIVIPLIALEDGNGVMQDEEARRRIVADAKKPFRLGEGPLCRFVLYQLADDKFVLGAHFHHIVIDGWSMKIFIDEFAAFYASARADSVPSVPALPFQYADFSVWQRACYDAGVWEKDMEYWKKQLMGRVAPLELPTDFARPPRQTYAGATKRRSLSCELSYELKRLGVSGGVTITTTIMTLWMVLLHRLTKREQFVVGAAAAAREEEGLERLLGFFTNTLVLKGDFSGNPSMDEALARVNSVAAEAYAHQMLPFERLVAELAPSRDASRTPLVQVLFASQVYVPEQTVATDVTIAVEELYNDTAKFDLTISILDRGDEVEVVLEYNTRLFAPSTAESYMDAFHALAEAAVKSPRAKILDMPMVSDVERERILVEWNRTTCKHADDLPVHALFRREAAHSPESIALVDGECVVTYGELAELADTIALSIAQKVDTKGAFIGIHLERSKEMVAAVIAVLTAGCVCVPLAADYPSERIAFMVADSDARLILTQENLARGLVDCSIELVLVDRLTTGGRLDEALEHYDKCSSESLAYVLYTSGSTGIPKGVAMPHQALSNLVRWQIEASYCGPKSRTLQFAPLSFDVSFQEMFVALAFGGTLVLVSEKERRDPELLLRRIEAEGIERLFLPTVMLQYVAAAGAERKDLCFTLKEVICAGEQLVISNVIREFFNRLGHCYLVNQYGPTESHVVSAYTLEGAAVEWPSLPPVGRPISNVSLYVLDDNLEVVPVGFSGELYIGGMGLASGYVGNAELTKEKFVQIPLGGSAGTRVYKSGDRARFLPSGDIEILGRSDQQVKVRGFRVELGEVEALLGECPEVQACAVSVYNDECESGERFGAPELVAYVVPNGRNFEETADVVALRELLEKRLPGYMVPNRFVVLSDLPLTDSGKVDRMSLPAPPRESRDKIEEVAIDPVNELEERLMEIWARLLKRDDFDVCDDFFELGGHSLLAIQFASEVKSVLAASMNLEEFFASPTIRTLSKGLTPFPQEAVQETKRSGALVCFREGARLPLFFAFGPGVLRKPYEQLAAAMDKEQSFFGFDDLRMPEGVPPDRAIETMARQCVEEVRRAQPRGPYLLGGYSFGGLLVIEMAQQLRAAGETVPALFLLDTFPQLGRREPIRFRLSSVPELFLRIRILVARFYSTWRLQIGYLRDGALLTVRRVFRLESTSERGISVAHLLRWWWSDSAMQHNLIQSGLSRPTIKERRLEMVNADLIRRNSSTLDDVIEAGKSYEIDEISSRLILLHAEHDPWRRAKRDATLGWGKYAAKGVETKMVRGNHITMVRTPYVESLGRTLQSYLSRFSPPTVAVDEETQQLERE